MRIDWFFLILIFFVNTIEIIAIHRKKIYQDLQSNIKENDKNSTLFPDTNDINRKRKIRSLLNMNYPNDQGYMSVYISESCRRSQAHRTMKFPYVRYDLRRYPSYGSWMRVSRRLPIYVEKYTKQTIIYAPNRLYVFPALMNYYRRVYSIAELLAYGYATFESNGRPMPSSFNIEYYAKPASHFSRDMPKYNPRTGGYNDVIRSHYRSNFKPDCPHEYSEQADDRQVQNNELHQYSNDKNQYYNAPCNRTRTPLPSQKNDDLCYTPYCIKAANYLLDSIDESVNPCEDFYNFACGTWIKNTRIPEDAPSQDNFNRMNTQLVSNLIDLLSSPINEINPSKAVINARNLYQSCMNEMQIELDNVEPVLSIVNNEFGGWPLLQGSSWNETNYNLTDLLIKLRRYDNGMMFTVVTYVNDVNSSIQNIYFEQGTLGLGDPAYYTSETPVTLAYRQFMFELAVQLGNNISINPADIEDIYGFEKNISQYYWNINEQRVRDSETIRTTVGNLSNVLQTNFDFTNYLRQAYLIGNVSLMDNDTVTVGTVAYLVNVSSIMQTFPPRVVQNYLIWRFMMNRASSMPKRIRSLSEQFQRIQQGTSAGATRSTTCAKYVNDNMGFAVSRLYIKKYFDENARNQSKEIFSNIRTAMIDMIQGADWMDEDSKRKAIEKEKAIYEFIGYPDFIASDDTTQLDQMYEEYVFNNSFISNVLLIQRVTAQNDFQKLRQVVDRRVWKVISPTIIDAFYGYAVNAIIFPAAVLQTPFFDKAAPKYLNYGGIGWFIGHEITHGFDDTGSQFDKDGNRIQWWSNDTINQFNQHKQCIIDQYSNYTIEQINTNLNGIQTQGENIADNGGVKSAFFAYQKWAKDNPNIDQRLPGLNKYSPEQLFFINYAQTLCAKFTDQYVFFFVLTNPHSFPQFRINGPLSNFKEFDRVFSCTPGQGTSRVNKCTVW